MVFKARVYRKGDELGLVELLSAVFPSWPSYEISCSKTEHWLWKYSDNPTSMSRVVLVETDEKIIGCHHTGYFNIKIGKNVTISAQAMDLGTHPEYRRKGVNKAIGELNMPFNASEGRPSTITYWATTNPLVIELNRRGGNPTFPQPVSYLIRVRNVDLQLEKMGAENKLVSKIGYEVLRVGSKIRGMLHPKYSDNIQISTLEMFDETITLFWESIKYDYDFILENSPNYLNWRYANPRGGSYRIRVAREENRILGYLISSISTVKEDYPEGYIVDLIALPERLDVLEALIKDSLKYFDDNNVNIVHCWIVKGNKYEKLLLSNEFVNSRREIGLVYNIQKETDDVDVFKKAHPDRLHFTYGSTDWI